MSEQVQAPPANVPAGSTNTAVVALKLWLSAYRVELALFAIAFALLAAFSSQRFLRQSAAPHFVYQAQAFLDGRLDLDFATIAAIAPGMQPEDWACVFNDANGQRQRCPTNAVPSGARWYSSFPAFPSVLMMPFVLIHGYQFNDTSFGVVLGALAIALFYSLLRLLREHEGTGRSWQEDAGLSLLLGFGTVFFYCAIRGEVWFEAEVLGVGLTALYVRNAVGARRPVLAGVFWSMAVLTRTPLVFTGIFFLLEAICPTHGQRREELKAFQSKPGPALEKLKRFALGAAPLGVAAMVFNQVRFGSVAEFGHRFFYFNRVNDDIDRFGLFSLHYLGANLDAAFLKLPALVGGQLSYDPWGLSLFLTLPILAIALVGAAKPERAWTALGVMGATLVLSAAMPGARIGERPTLVWLVLAGALGVLAWQAWKWTMEPKAPRLAAPLLITLACCAVPGLLYMNTGYAQFGFRFSLDYTPYVVLLLAIGGWSFKKPLAAALVALAVAVNFWGAVAFRGYTELVRHWQ